ncbi:MAG: Gfo/Idh/MocA family protein [Breznakia sp.]
MKIATIGTGFIVDSFIETSHIVEHAEMEAVYSRDIKKATAFANKHNILKAYDNLDTMFQDETIDIIYIASPNSLHYEQAKQALRAKKHVICEKPFTSNPKELADLIQTAKQYEVMIFEAITTIHLPNFKLLQQSLHILGNIRMVNLCYCQYSSRYDAYTKHKASNVFSLEFSGGALMDINIYNIHFCVALFGKPNKLSYFPSLGYNGIDTNGILVLEYDNFHATLIGAKDSTNDNFSYIQGDRGNLRIKGSVSTCENIIHLPLEVSALGRRTAGEMQEISQSQDARMSYELRDFMQIITTHDTKEYERLLQHSIDVMDVLYVARKDANIVFSKDK